MQCDCLVGGELGIALSGGGAKSLAQVGVLKVLDREGVPISYVAGTSAGAIIGAVYVTSSNAFEAEERLLTHLRTTGIGFNAETFALLPGSRTASSPGWLEVGRGFWRATRANGALIGGEEMRASLRVLYGDATFSEARMPFATTALDLVSGRRVIFAGGDLVDATYASSAIPGLFEPLALDDSLLVDGGWAEPVPVNACHHLGAVHVVGVEVPPNRTSSRVGQCRLLCGPTLWREISWRRCSSAKRTMSCVRGYRCGISRTSVIQKG